MTAYRWDNFYIPLGLVYGLTTFTAAPGTAGSYSTTNGVGSLLGIGWMFDDFAIEYVGRSATTSLNAKSGLVPLRDKSGVRSAKASSQTLVMSLKKSLDTDALRVSPSARVFR